MKHFALMLLLLPLLGRAQEEKKGTYFEHGLSWTQVKEKAKKENKYLFLDCYTTWCGPCKYMANVIFPQEKMGLFFNKNFVNAKVQLDKTDKDSEEVKSWYADGEAIAKNYKVSAYPTFLIFSPSGELVHRIVGGADADDFIAKAQKALDPETQYYTQLKEYEAGEKSPEFLRRFIALAMDAFELEKTSQIAAAYLESQDESDLYTKENLEFLVQYTRDSKSRGFRIMLNDGAKIDAIMGKGTALKKVSSIILQEDIYPNIRSYDVNLDSLKKTIHSKYPTVQLDEGFAELNLKFLQAKQDWKNFQPAILDYMAKYGSNISQSQLNSFAWTVFESCYDKDCVAQALVWSKRSIDESKEEIPAFIYTYANLLYKSGNTQEALAWQKKAVNLVTTDEKPVYQATLEKMKKGEKTWPDGSK